MGFIHNALSKVLASRRSTTFSDFPASSLTRLGFSTPNAAGVTVTEESSLNSSAVFAATQLYAKHCASLPLVLYRRDGDDRRRAVDHPLSKLLSGRVNPSLSSYMWKELIGGNVILNGNHYSRIETNAAGQVVGLYPYSPHAVQPERLKNGNVRYVCKNADGTTSNLPASRVLHVAGPGWNGLKSPSRVELAANTIGLAVASERLSSKFFSNGAQLSGLLRVPGRLSDEAAKRLAAGVNAKHAGADNAYKLAVVEEGISFQPMSLSFKDAEVLALRKFSVTEICRFFEVPPHLVADLERATFSNIEDQSRSFVVNTLAPFLVRIESALNLALLTDLERETYYFEFLLESLLRGSPALRFDTYSKAFSNGWMSTNEIRKLENLNQLSEAEGGDRRFRPANLVPLDHKAPALGSNSKGPYIRDILGRLVNREIRGVGLLLRRKESVLAFYDDDFRATLSEALLPMVRSAAVGRSVTEAQVMEMVSALAEEYIDSAFGVVTEALAKGEDKDLRALLKSWGRTRAEQLASSMEAKLDVLIGEIKE